MRIVVLDTDKCNPKKCAQECMINCPVVRSGTEMFEFETRTSQPIIHEQFCTGCGICPRICRFHALTIVNTPERLDKEMTHRFGMNGFSLFRLPVIKPRRVNGFVGQNGIGKSTALKVLSGDTIPNFGVYNHQDLSVIEGYERAGELLGLLQGNWSFAFGTSQENHGFDLLWLLTGEDGFGNNHGGGNRIYIENWETGVADYDTWGCMFHNLQHECGEVYGAIHVENIPRTPPYSNQTIAIMGKNVLGNFYSHLFVEENFDTVESKKSYFDGP